MKKAIIDIGSNTINLLIGEISENGRLQVYHDEKNHAKLAKGGINNRTITPEAFTRGLRAIEHYVHLCHMHKVEAKDIKVYATATIRNTNNGKEFTDTLQRQLGIDTAVIDGDTEASLIYNGVKSGIPTIAGNFLVLDIGGGSTEFIIAGEDGILWKKSFELGVSKMLDLFAPADPISIKDIQLITSHYTEQLKPLDEALHTYKVETLVGSSGSFDTIKSMILASDLQGNHQASYFNIEKEELSTLFSDLIAKSTAQRALIKGMDPMRVDYMPIAALLIKLVLEKTGVQTIYQCSYALKEGALFMD